MKLNIRNIKEDNYTKDFKPVIYLYYIVYYKSYYGRDSYSSHILSQSTTLVKYYTLFNLTDDCRLLFLSISLRGLELSYV